MRMQDYSDVARDFLRIAGVVPARPDLPYLARLARAFGRLPYENLTKILRAATYEEPDNRLRTPDIVLADHLDLGAGGTCFSLTNFFEQVLRFAGFDAAPVLCDRSYGAETHCALIVNAEGRRYLVDPGYLIEAPIEIPARGESVQQGSSCTVRLRRLGESSQLMLITENSGKAKVRYRMRDLPATPQRFLDRWIDSFDWAMMRHMCVSRNEADGLLFMRDGAVRKIVGSDERRGRIDDSFANEVQRTFGIDARVVSMAREAVVKIRDEFRGS